MDEQNHNLNRYANNVLCKNYIQNGRFECDFICPKHLIIKLSELISSIKALHYENPAKRLNIRLLQAKSYW